MSNAMAGDMVPLPADPKVLDDVTACLATTLQLGATDGYTADTRLLGSLPELDSMAVVSVILALEEHFGFEVDDDEISADTFETIGSLSRFVAGKLGHLA